MKRYTIHYIKDNKKKEKTFSDSYISLERIKKPSSFSAVFDNKCILTNIKDINIFKEDLHKFEKKTSSNNGKHIYGVVLSFLLDKEHSNEDLVTLTKEISKRYEDLPFFAYKIHQGKGTYLNVYFCERVYYPDGYKTEVRCKKDIYKNKETKKYCNPDDENACLFKKKGEVLKTKRVKFSSKKDCFRFKDHTFTKIWTEFRLWFMQLLYELFDMPIEDGISFPQFVVHKQRKSIRPIARSWNETLRKMSWVTNEVIKGLMIEGPCKEEPINQLYQLIGTYYEVIKKGEIEFEAYKGKMIKTYISYNGEPVVNDAGKGILFGHYEIEAWQIVFPPHQASEI